MLYHYNSGTTGRSCQRGGIMVEPFDVYVDQMTIGAGPFGVALNFRKTSPRPVAPGTNLQVEEVGTVRMSLEHFKVMAFLLQRQIREVESQLGVQIPIPVQLMNQLKIAPEDWERFWRPLD